MRFYEYLFWDFDGVIKDSVDVKTQAYFDLFKPFGLELAEKVRNHHLANCGISRFEKLPLYLKWANLDNSKNNLNHFCELYSSAVLNAVIDSPWVAGVESFLKLNPYNQKFYLVSATPQNELEYILKKLNISDKFTEIFGAPASKKNSIQNVILQNNIKAKSCLMIGDAMADLDAAKFNQIDFLLRKHNSNSESFDNFTGQSICDFKKIPEMDRKE